MLFILMTGCISTKRETLKNHKGLFTSDEIDELNSIVESFDIGVSEVYPSQTIDGSYSHYAKEILQRTQEGINLEPHERILSVFDTAKKLSVSNDIWWFNDLGNGNLQVNIKPDGKYMSYLEELGSDYPFIKSYHGQLVKHGDLGAANILGSFAKKATSFNFKDKNIRLVFTIHYLTFYNL